LISCLSIFAKIKKINFEIAFPLIWIFSNCWLMFIQQSSLSNYCYIFLMPIMFLFSSNKSPNFIIITLLFSFACTIQPPIWWGQKMPIYKDATDLLIPINMVEYSLEIFIVGCIIYFCGRIFKTISKTKHLNGAS
jgi:predicted MFS family arabinose efflux permease